MDRLPTLLYVSGLFTLLLGIAHFFFPILFDFQAAIPKQGDPLKPFRLGPIRYQTQRSDVFGIAWVMSNAASYALVTIGLLDLCWTLWMGQSFARLLFLWIAGWWFLRAVSQLFLGHRRLDWLILFGFAALGFLHLIIALTLTS